MDSITVNGKTVYVWSWPHNYADNLDFSQQFITSIYSNRQHDEQRRPLLNRNLREIGLSHRQQNTFARRLKNNLKKITQEYCLVPLPQHVIAARTDLFFEQVVFSEDANDFSVWTRNYTDYIVAIDQSDYSAFVEKIVGFDSGNNRVTVENDFNLPKSDDNYCFYPGMIARLKNSQPQGDFEATNLFSVKVNFREVVL